MVLSRASPCCLTLSGLSDPYLEIFAPQEQKFKTKTIKKTLNPHWNQTFEITNLHDEDEVPLPPLPLSSPLSSPTPSFSPNDKDYRGLLGCQC